jgi:glycosyltransferase involved in cell wall biosynthesis
MRELALVIPTRGRSALLRRCLAHVQAQTARARIAEVIVVEDGPSGEAARVLEHVARQGLPLVRVVQDPARGPAAARNRGLARAMAPVTVLLGDDVLLVPDALERLCEAGLPVRDASYSLLGLVTWHPEEPIGPFMYWQEHGGSQFAYEDIASPEDAGWRFYGTAFVATNTELLRRVGFDERFPIARYEDMELGYRLERDHGHRVRLAAAAVGWHVHPMTLLEWLARVPRMAAPALHFARVSGDASVARTIGVASARAIGRFLWADLVRAADLVRELEPRVPIPPRATEVYGQLWEWECLATAYRVIQNFFFLAALRDEMALPAAVAVDARLDATEARRALLERLRGDGEPRRAGAR